MKLFAVRMESPVGGLFGLATPSGAIRALEFEEDRRGQRDPAAIEALWRRRGACLVWSSCPVLVALERALGAYFEGRLQTFDLPLDPMGTPFQRLVWTALLEIPYGCTESYGGLARRIGRPGAARAVGLANGKNPIPILVPCHRVVGADGTLTGYGGGIAKKRALLDLERAQCVWAP